MRLSYNDRRQLVAAAIGKGWVVDLYDDAVVYSPDDGTQLIEASYTLDPATRTVTLGAGTQVTVQTEYVPLVAPATYSLGPGVATFSADGATVRRSGKIFEIGAYPDQHFTLSEADADAAVAAFQPVPMELEHFHSKGQPSIFDGKLGQLTRVWRDGTELHGEVEVPTWADAPWGEWGRKVSTVWNRVTKQLERCGMVLNPAVGDAVMMAAFSAAHPAPQRATVKEHVMSFLDEMRALAQKYGLPVGEGTPGTGAAPLAAASAPTFAAAAPVVAAAPAAPPVDDRLTAAFAQIAEMQATFRRQQAVTLVTQLQSEGKIPTWEVAFAVEDLTRALADDTNHPDPVTFALPGQATPVSMGRADLKVAAYRNRPVNHLLGERLPAALFGAVPDAAEDADLAESDAAILSYLDERPDANRATTTTTTNQRTGTARR